MSSISTSIYETNKTATEPMYEVRTICIADSSVCEVHLNSLA